MGKNNNSFNVNEYRTYTWTICVNIQDARAKFAMIIDFLCFFMPITIAKRIISSILLISGAPRQFLVDMGICCLRSAGTYDRMIKNGHLQELFSIKKGSGRAAFYKGVAHNYIDEVKDLIDNRNFYCYRDIQKALKDEFGLNPSLSAIRYTLKKWGYKWRKCGSLPAKADPALQTSFYEGTLHPLMMAAQAGKCHLLFMDAAHFVYGCGFLGRIISKTRRFIRTHCGRKRYNVLGALDFVTKEVLTVTNNTYITATEIVDMLGKIHKKYGDDGLPIKIILDNARYQKCEIVTKAAEIYNITSEYLPSYSPNLNLIERLWKYVKSDIRANIVNIDEFDAFKAHIDKVLSETGTSRLSFMKRLIGEKVQLFDDNVIVA